MKIKRLYENSTLKDDTYYQVREYTDEDEYLIIPPEEEDGYVFNYDAHNLEEVIEFYFDKKLDYGNGDFKVIKITEEEIDDDRMKMMRDAKKYNL